MNESRLARIVGILGCLGDEDTCDDEKHTCISAEIEREIIRIRSLFLGLSRDIEEVRAYRCGRGGQSCGPPCNELLSIPPSTMGYLDRLARNGLMLTEGFSDD